MKTIAKAFLTSTLLLFFSSVTSVHAQSGLVGKAVELPKIMLSSGMPMAEAPLELEAGVYYEITIEADGSQELAISGAAFFRNLWIDEIVINDIEIRPLVLIPLNSMMKVRWRLVLSPSSQVNLS